MADDDNNLLNYMNDKENENKDIKIVLTNTISEITLKTDCDTDFTFIEWDNIFDKLYAPYPAKDEIPILKINNKDCFFN